MFALADRSEISEPAVLRSIWEGMRVVDVDGSLVGSVKYVREGSPSASVVLDDAPFAEDDLNQAFARALTAIEPNVDRQFAERLIQDGFLKVAGSGLLGHNRYVAAGQIAGIDDDSVSLATSVDQLVVESLRWI